MSPIATCIDGDATLLPLEYEREIPVDPLPRLSPRALSG